MHKYLNKAEFILVGVLTIAIALEFFYSPSSLLYGISLSGLALVFFLFAQFPSDNTQSQEKGAGFKALLGLTIVPKILWISTAITTTGIFFYLQDFQGAINLLTIGGLSIAICTVLLMVLRFMSINGLETVIPILYRSYPALLAAAYFVFV